jgi:hypothetical protein
MTENLRKAEGKPTFATTCPNFSQLPFDGTQANAAQKVKEPNFCTIYS